MLLIFQKEVRSVGKTHSCQIGASELKTPKRIFLRKKLHWKIDQHVYCIDGSPTALMENLDGELTKAPRGNSKNMTIINSKKNKTLRKTENIPILYVTQSWVIYIKHILTIDLTRNSYLTCWEKRKGGEMIDTQIPMFYSKSV